MVEHKVRVIVTNQKNEVLHENLYPAVGEYCFFDKKFEIKSIKFGWLWYDNVDKFRDKIMSVYKDGNKFEIVL